MNVGLICNWGVELSLGGMFVFIKNWKWEMNFNIVKNSNKLVELVDGVDFYFIYWILFIICLYNYVMVGKLFGVIIGNIWECDDNGNIIFYELSVLQKVLYGGEYVFIYNQNILDELGNFYLDFIGGFNISISFKNFCLLVNIDFFVGGQIVFYINMWGSSSGIFDKIVEFNDCGVNVCELVSKGGGIYMIGVDQNGNKVDIYVNVKLYYIIVFCVWEEWVYDCIYVKFCEVLLLYVFLL